MTPELPERFIAARRAFLGTSGEDGRPHVVPVCFTLSAGRLYVAIDEKPKSGRPLRRLRNIAANPNVTLTVDQYSDDWTELWWTVVEGQAAVLACGSQRPAALTSLREKYAQYQAMRLEDLPLVEIEATRVVSWQAS